ncbi:MAG: pilus assembly protein [Devosia sp.]|uniref:TadE/TadG family type IV pilus assembly protein n=1 Tax=Devosia sp. TaxID=1871048 RepID=UPI00263488FC|nr:pilus assembly protein TadG-related protein [Devosia sp.]MDB5589166.1 pilus assembly protein [Devosia sp.]
MGRLVNLLKQFRSDERGVFGVIFALTAIVLIALSGAVVDFVTVEQARNRAQVALDAAALALQKDIFLTPLNAAAIQSKAQALVTDQIGDDRIKATLNAPVISVNNGSLYLSAHLTVPTIFVALVGVNQMDANIISEARRKKTALEMVMVLDNSGSMAGARMTNLKSASTCATNILFYGTVNDTTCVPVSTAKVTENVSIGIVPFTVMVNVGTQYKDATWLDWTGKSSVSRTNFDNDDDATTTFAGPVDRKALFTTTGTTWAGCVEARKSPYDTTDDAATTTNPDTLFVPLFTPDPNSAYAKGALRPAVAAGGENNYLASDTPVGKCPIRTCEVTTVSGNTTYKMTDGSVVTTPAASCVRSDSVFLSKSGNTETYSLLSRVELQNRLCKYTGFTVTNDKTNYGCPSVPVLPMTQIPKSVTDRITSMVAAGSTNIQQGAVWGMHALTHEEPMTEGSDKSDIDVRKALIIMTDGENDPPFTASDVNGGAYFSWGFPFDGRLAEFVNQVDTETKVRAIQDAKTLAACTYAKNVRHIEVYTIGLSSPAGVKAMLTTCSSGSGYNFFPNDPKDLISVFRAIANQLAPLTIAQ